MYSCSLSLSLPPLANDDEEEEEEEYDDDDDDDDDEGNDALYLSCRKQMLVSRMWRCAAILLICLLLMNSFLPHSCNQRQIDR